MVQNERTLVLLVHRIDRIYFIGSATVAKTERQQKGKVEILEVQQYPK